MLVVDTSCLYDVLVGKASAERIRQRLLADGELAAPHILDAEVLGVIRRDFLLGQLDPTAATQAVVDLRDWCGERFGHRPLLERAWELPPRSAEGCPSSAAATSPTPAPAPPRSPHTGAAA